MGKSFNRHGLRGIEKTANGFRASARVRSKKTHLGTWPTREMAALAYDCACLEYHSKTPKNFPRFAHPKRAQVLLRDARAAMHLAGKRASRYKGVYPVGDKYQVAIRLPAKKQSAHTSRIEDEIEAAKTFDALARHYRGPDADTNFDGERACSIEQLGGSRSDHPGPTHD